MKAADAAAANAKQEAADPPGESSDIVRVAAVDPAQINFAYTVAGPNTPWKPVRAFDDGSHVYVQMPAGMKSSGAPPAHQRRQRNADGELPGQGKLLRRRPTIQRRDSGFRSRPRSRPRDHFVRGRSEVTAMATADVIQEQDEQDRSTSVAAVSIAFSVLFSWPSRWPAAWPSRSVSSPREAVKFRLPEIGGDPGSAARDRGEIEGLGAHCALPHAGPTVMPIPPCRSPRRRFSPARRRLPAGMRNGPKRST